MSKRVIQVCGDPTVDWLNVSNETEPGLGPYFFEPDQPVLELTLGSQAGGAALLAELLREMIPSDRAEIQGIELAQELLTQPIDSPVTRAWTSWKRCGNADFSAFRIENWGRYERGDWDYVGNQLKGVPDLLCIDDSGLGFRKRENSGGWPEALAPKASGRPRHILLKLSLYGDWLQKSKEDGTWNPPLDRIMELGLAPNTTVVTAISDLRAGPARVARSLSWERILEEVVAAVRSPSCPFVNPQSGELRFPRVIVTIGAAGAVIVEEGESLLVFDRSGQEGDFERRFSGGMMGYNTCVMGALAAAWEADQEDTDWGGAALAGVALARELQVAGYLASGTPPNSHLRFPGAHLADTYREHQAANGSRGITTKGNKRRPEVWNLGVFVDRQGLTGKSESIGKWTILGETLAGCAKQGRLAAESSLGCVCQCARAIVREGPEKSLHNSNMEVPIETVGNWRSADRHEIEGVRSVNNAMQEYLQLSHPGTPMAVAVFGPPGAGKSFAVKEIAKGLNITKDSQLTFNLSQFESPEELTAAFHQVRDLHFTGKMPLVFWDEFDGRCGDTALGWLRHFLVPLQDGLFLDRGQLHPTGGGIYVFAGGTCRSFQEFSRGSAYSSEDRAAKKPDFVSRLRAYIDVKGPNGDPNLVEDELYPIRRAFLLNSLLRRHAGHLERGREFQIGDQVLDAFLRTITYRHGARSMESLVRMSSLKSKRRYELSSLPPQHLLEMHVDSWDFLSLTRQGHRELLRVGITGHIGLDPEKLPLVEQAIDRAIQRIEEAFPNRALTVFSPLAVGADRLVARALLERDGSNLIAVLPVPRGGYEEDFGPTNSHREDYDSAELRQEFRYWLDHKAIETIVMPPSATRRESYQKVGFYIVEHSDVMIAVWDGRESQGRGGTAEIVARARALGKPVAHVWAGNYKDDPKKRTEPDPGEYGEVTFYNLAD